MVLFSMVYDSILKNPTTHHHHFPLSMGGAGLLQKKIGQGKKMLFYVVWC